MRVTVVSQSERLLGLVRDFALGLGVASEPAPPSQVALSLTQASDETVLHLLTHVALSATKSGVETSELLNWPGVPPMFTFRDQDGELSSVDDPQTQFFRLRQFGPRTRPGHDKSRMAIAQG